MRIVVITEVFLPKIDGVVTRVTRTLDQLAEMDHEVLIVAPGSPPPTYAGFDVVRVPSVPFWPIYPEIGAGLITPGLFRAIRSFRPDVVHAVNPMWMAGFASIVANRMGLPILASFHTDVPEYTVRLGARWLEKPSRFGIRLFHGQAQVNLVTSAPMLDKAREYGIPNVQIWPKAVDTVGFHPAKRSRETRAMLSDDHPDAPLVLFVGRLSAEKSTARTLGIMEALRERVPDARLALVGDGPQGEELRRTMDRDWITFTGYLSGEQLHAAYASGDALLFPSTTETLGFAALEAFASGVPVVAARAGGLPYVIEDGETGYLVDPDLPDSAWVDPLESVLTDPRRRDEMSRAARSEARAWTWRAATERLVELYEQAQAAKQ
ncbi:glycosyltransferase family 1 protein [Corynebacterium sp.]|uniref:glycosyltransferase family 4 protein n=1 Tax=Corynebacterium sp. TaxID=1720 RepID=UPI002A909810|nr:glycosyltransferase family 1 protein [Corynebacterium sp.]MDY5785888.1 glycosyltransferase family 1 protein [Corynebacterium sp.]